MSHTPDLQMLDAGEFAIGWLHPDHPFAQADPAPEFLAKLKQIATRAEASATALGLGAMCGIHTCEFCNNAHGVANFGVPAGEKLYFCPEMIVHYVEVHRYAPPAEFIAAVMNCPLPGTREYVAAVQSIVQRQRALLIKNVVSITLENHVALVLFEYLSRLSESDAFHTEQRAEQVAIWSLIADLESILVEPFDPQYEALLEDARQRVVNYGIGPNGVNLG